MKRVFVIHGWEGTPQGDWFPWLRKELEDRGFEVNIPEMPDTNNPKIAPWINTIKKVVGKMDKNTYFIGHSIGVQAILRYFESIADKSECGGSIFVAGWMDLTPQCWVEGDDSKVAEPWIKTPIDWKKVKTHCKKFISIFSDNDPYVDISNSKIFEREIGAKTRIVRGLKHMNTEAGVTELPIVLKELLKLAKDL